MLHFDIGNSIHLYFDLSSFMLCSSFFCDIFVLILILIKIRCAGGAPTWTSYVVGTGPSRTSSRQK